MMREHEPTRTKAGATPVSSFAATGRLPAAQVRLRRHTRPRRRARRVPRQAVTFAASRRGSKHVFRDAAGRARRVALARPAARPGHPRLYGAALRARLRPGAGAHGCEGCRVGRSRWCAGLHGRGGRGVRDGAVRTGDGRKREAAGARVDARGATKSKLLVLLRSCDRYPRWHL